MCKITYTAQKLQRGYQEWSQSLKTEKTKELAIEATHLKHILFVKQCHSTTSQDCKYY